jgi:hypothetical protein
MSKLVAVPASVHVWDPLDLRSLLGRISTSGGILDDNATPRCDTLVDLLEESHAESVEASLLCCAAHKDSSAHEDHVNLPCTSHGKAETIGVGYQSIRVCCLDKIHDHEVRQQALRVVRCAHKDLEALIVGEKPVLNHTVEFLVV